MTYEIRPNSMWNEVERIEVLLNDLSDDDFRELFHTGCEAENVYPEYENDGSVYYSGMPEVAAWMLEEIRVDTDITAQGAARRAVRDGWMGDLFAQGGAV